MVTTEAQRRAFKKRRLKLKYIKLDFNTENQKDVEILEKFDDIAMRFPNKKEAFIYLVEKAEE